MNKNRFMFLSILMIAIMSTMVVSACGDDEEESNGSPKSKVYLTCPDNNHPHAIDLGLPSGTKWCCCNVGATTPEDYGGYFAWGETSEKSVYSEETYLYSSETDEIGIHYQNIGSDIAGTSYDVAHVKMGGSWRMPSTTQQEELMDNCTREWTSQNGVKGILVTGSNGGRIFLPAAGGWWKGELDDDGAYGYYLSSSLYTDDSNGAYGMYFCPDDWVWGGFNRCYGLSIRAVCP